MLIEPTPAALPGGFRELPAIVYAGDAMWVPEDPAALDRAFSPARAWFETGESAAFCIPGKARLATFASPRISVDGKPAVYFGYWETIGDDDADAAIFRDAEAWASDRGAKAIWGPVNFSTFASYRVRLTAEIGASTFLNEPYNPDYYPKILERLGYLRGSEALTQRAEAPLASSVGKTRAGELAAVRATGVRVEALSHQLWVERLPEFWAVVSATFATNWGYTPIELGAFEQACGASYIRKTCPSTGTVAFAPDGSIIGFFLVYPHWGPLIVQSAGSARVCTSELDYATHWPRLVETGFVNAVCKTAGILPEWRGQGIFTALTVSMFERGEGVFSEWYGALLGADRLARRYGDGLADDSRWYAVYGKDLTL